MPPNPAVGADWFGSLELLYDLHRPSAQRGLWSEGVYGRRRTLRAKLCPGLTIFWKKLSSALQLSKIRRCPLEPNADDPAQETARLC
jgi:hypothetical protein